MIVYQTNHGLGYNQFAYFIRLGVADIGHEYVCIGMNYDNDHTMYAIGEQTEMEEWEVERSSFKVTDSELSGTFLFEHFLKTCPL